MAAKKIVFTSGKGGVGKSTLAVAMSKILNFDQKKVLMIDFDIGLRSLDIMLNTNEIVYDWGDVIGGVCKIQNAIVKTKGGDLLAAPLRNVFASVQQIKEMIKSVENDYDFIILDSPAGIGTGFSLATAASDFALIISTPDEVCVRSAAVAARQLDENNIKSRLIINKFEKKAVKEENLLNIDSVIDSVGVQLIGVVPIDNELSFSMQKGLPLLFDLKSCQAMVRIIKRLYGHNIKLKF